MQEIKISIREAISQVKNLFKQVNADSRLTNKEVFSLLKKHAAWIIKRESERLRLIRMDGLFQPYNCIKVIKAPIGDGCCGLRSKLNCEIYRTEEKIPEMYEDLFGPIIRRITSIDGFTDIKLSTVKGIKRFKNNRYANKYLTSETIQAYYNDGYIYFPEKHLRVISIEALFTEELDRTNLDCSPCAECEEECVKFLDKKLMLSTYLLAQVMDAIKADLGIREQIPEKAHSIDKNDNK